MVPYWKRPAPMRVPALAAAAILLLAAPLHGFQAPARAASPGRQPAPGAQQNKASIEGVAVDGPSGKPVKDATLMLMERGSGGPSANSRSDEEGRFAFKGLDAGKYTIMVQHPKYARQLYGSSSGMFGGITLTLSAGQAMRELTFRLQPNAVASGRVLDNDGEPVPNLLVLALQSLYMRGKRQMMFVSSASTNDLGEFRILNLAAGRYFLLVSQLRPLPKPGGDGREQAYVPTFYPNAPDASGAAPVVLTAGGDVSGLDIRLAKLNAVRIKGKVTGAPPDRRIFVRLIPRDAGPLWPYTGRSALVRPGAGAFEIVGATPGSYVLRAGEIAYPKPFGAGLPLEIADKDVEGIVLDASPGGEVAGTVVIEGAAKPPLKGTRVFLESFGEGAAMGIPANVEEGGKFVFKDTAPDMYLVRLGSLPPGTWLRTVRLGRREMTDEGLDMGGAVTEPIEIRLETGAPQVNGVVRGPDDKPVPGATVALVPDSRRYPLYKGTFTDQNGAFAFQNLNPGDYKLLAWEEVEPLAYMDPEFLRAFEGKAESVSLKEKDQKTVTLKLIPKDNK